MNLFAVPTSDQSIDTCFETAAPVLKILKESNDFISLSNTPQLLSNFPWNRAIYQVLLRCFCLQKWQKCFSFFCFLDSISFFPIFIKLWNFYSKMLHQSSINFFKIIVAVTSNSLAKQSSFRESFFVISQANYRKIHRTNKRKWNKRIFLISNLQIPIHFLLSLHTSHENEMLVLLVAVNNMRPQQKLLLRFYVKK